MPALCVLLASSKQAVQAAALALTQVPTNNPNPNPNPNLTPT